MAKNVHETLALEIPIIFRVDDVIEQRAVVVPQRQFKQPGTMGNQVLAFRMGGQADEIVEPPHVGTVDEACLGIEPGGNVLIHGVELKLARTAFQKDPIRRTRLVRAIVEFGLAGHGLSIELPVLIDPDVCIESADAVEAHHAARGGAETVGTGLQFAVGVYEADSVVLPDLAVETEHSKVCVVPRQRIARDHALARRAVIGQEGADGPWSYLAGQLDAVQRIDDAPRKHQIERRLKIAGVLLEERAFFRKENLEALVDRDLGIVRLNLAEVRIDGGVEHQAIFDDDL